MKVYKTSNYNKFDYYCKFKKERMLLNHIKRLADRIIKVDLTSISPIICINKGGKLYIVDGMHRFEACKHLKKPIYYIGLSESKFKKSLKRAGY